MLELDDMDKDAVPALAAAVLDEMVAWLNGDKGARIAWDHAVFGVALAIKSLTIVAGKVESLSDDQVREMALSAITAALATPVQTLHCETLEELEELSAALEDSPGPDGNTH